MKSWKVSTTQDHDIIVVDGSGGMLWEMNRRTQDFLYEELFLYDLDDDIILAFAKHDAAVGYDRHPYGVGDYGTWRDANDDT